MGRLGRRGSSWNLPEDQTDDIDERYARRAAGFGSVRVEATIGSTRWQTSIFPSKENATYVLPLKKAVRVAEGSRARFAGPPWTSG